MRGAVSVALVYFYYDPDGATVDREKSTLISMTLTVVLFSTLVFGAATKPLLDLMLGPESAQQPAVACIIWKGLPEVRRAHGLQVIASSHSAGASYTTSCADAATPPDLHARA